MSLFGLCYPSLPQQSSIPFCNRLKLCFISIALFTIGVGFASPSLSLALYHLKNIVWELPLVVLLLLSFTELERKTPDQKGEEAEKIILNRNASTPEF